MSKMSFSEALHILLAYMPAKQVLSKGIWLKMAIQDG